MIECGPQVCGDLAAGAAREWLVTVVHRLPTGGPVRLTLDAIVIWRDAHAERTAGPPPRVAPVARGAVVEGAYRLAWYCP
jgi:hypothetical protein